MFSNNFPSSHSLKKVRRGTRSCAECRRRKNRCIFNSDARVCNGCISRGTSCIPQGVVVEKPTRSRNQDDTELLASLVNQLILRLDAEATLPVNPATKGRTVEALKDLYSQLLLGPVFETETSLSSNYKMNVFAPTYPITPTATSDANSGYSESVNPMRKTAPAPLLTMLDNVVLQQEGWVGIQTDGQPSILGYDSMAETGREVLRSMKKFQPSFEDLDTIFSASHTGWGWWERQLSELPVISAERIAHKSFSDFVHRSLSSEDPMQVIRGTICLVTGIQQLPTNFDKSQMSLPASLEVLQEHFLVALDIMLACDTFSSTIEGMECMVILAQFYADLGAPTKTWLM
jgi:hypothetical protein